MIRLERPNIKYKDSYIKAVQEIKKKGAENESNEDYLKKSLEELENSFEGFVKDQLETHKGLNEGRVPNTNFWIIDENDEYCGKISLRHYLNENLKKFGGHIGYDVIPSKRGNSYATKALTLCLKEAKKFGLEKVLLTCDDDNIPSIKSIERNGGVFQDKIQYKEEVLTRRYWIDLKWNSML